MLASYNGHADIVSILLDAGANVNEKTKNDMDALKVATYNGHIDIVRILLSKGANPSTGGRIGAVSAWFIAKMRGHENIKQLLEK